MRQPLRLDRGGKGAVRRVAVEERLPASRTRSAGTPSHIRSASSRASADPRSAPRSPVPARSQSIRQGPPPVITTWSALKSPWIGPGRRAWRPEHCRGAGQAFPAAPRLGQQAGGVRQGPRDRGDLVDAASHEGQRMGRAVHALPAPHPPPRSHPAVQRGEHAPGCQRVATAIWTAQARRSAPWPWKAPRAPRPAPGRSGQARAASGARPPADGRAARQACGPAGRTAARGAPRPDGFRRRPPPDLRAPLSGQNRRRPGTSLSRDGRATARQAAPDGPVLG
jgi:hypothetical protein